MVPMIIDRDSKVIGGANSLILHLVNSHKTIRDNLYKEESKANVDMFLGWFDFRMRPETRKMIHLIVRPKVSGNPPPPKDQVVS